MPCARAMLLVLGACALGCAPGGIDALIERPVPTLPLNTTGKLLHWGAGIPVGSEQLSYFVDHLAEIEQSPFDGTVLDLGAASAWHDGVLEEADLRLSAARLASAALTSFTDNFQLLGWGEQALADDAKWQQVEQNLTLLGDIAVSARLRGFMLDTQQYASFGWSYARLPEPRASFALAEGQAYGRGRQLMQGLVAGFPEVVVLVTLGTSDVFREVCISGTPLEASDYALLPAFLDGMQAAREEARMGALLIDAYLPSYSTLDPAAFRLYHDLIHGDLTALEAHWLPSITTYRWAVDSDDQAAGESIWPQQFALTCTESERAELLRNTAASFAVMLDYPSRAALATGFQTDPARFGENSHTPGQYTDLLRSALQASDRYVWSWTSELLWWPKPNDDRPLVPAAYVQAARLAREQAHETRLMPTRQK